MSAASKDAARMLHTNTANAVASAAIGCLMAQRLVQRIAEGRAQPDALFDELRSLVGAEDRERLRAWAHELSKRLERAVTA